MNACGELIRAGYIANGDFITDRDSQVNGPHLVFALDQARFAVVNRMSGEFAILDPSTPAARTVAVPFMSGSAPIVWPVTTAHRSIWSLVHGAWGARRFLIQLAPDGSIGSRTTLRLSSGFRPLKIAISGSDVYLVGFTPTAYRYELP